MNATTTSHHNMEMFRTYHNMQSSSDSLAGSRLASRGGTFHLNNLIIWIVTPPEGVGKEEVAWGGGVVYFTVLVYSLKLIDSNDEKMCQISVMYTFDLCTVSFI